MKVADLMSRSPITIGPDTSARAARETMHEYDVRRLLVTDPGSDHLLGILSARDIDDDEIDAPVRGLMTTHLVVIGAGASIGDAARRMLSHKVDGLPVVRVDDDGDPHLIGIVTTTDLLRYLADREGEPPAEG